MDAYEFDVCGDDPGVYFIDHEIEVIIDDEEVEPGTSWVECRKMLLLCTAIIKFTVILRAQRREPCR